MDVDFNNLREKLLSNYNALIDILNDSVEDREIRIPTNEIQNVLKDIRNELITLGCLYESGNSDCRCIINKDTKVSIFEPEKTRIPSH